MLAAIHEFGTDTVPERAPFRTSVRANQKKYSRALGKVMQKAVQTENPEAAALQGYEAVGALAAADVQETISNRLPPPLKPETIARKGSSVPLIDIGEFRQSITHEVRKDA